MLIIVEGADGAGKSTLCNRIAEEIGGFVHRLHRGKLERHPLEEYELDLDWYAPGSGEHIICDRWHLGEAVYGPKYRGRSEMDSAMMLHIELFLRARGALLVHMYGDPDLLASRLDADEWVKREEINDLQRRYMMMHGDSILPWFEWHVGKVDERMFFDRVMVAAKRAEEAASVVASIPTYVGQPEPQYLLVGEMRNDLRYNSAFVPYRNTSGHYLLGCVPEDWRYEFGLLNALEQQDIMKSWLDLGRPSVVALGRSAQRVLEKAKVPHGVVPHPQFVRRFHNGERSWYTRLIEQAGEWSEDFAKERP
jgi:hypothetical protein